MSAACFPCLDGSLVLLGMLPLIAGLLLLRREPSQQIHCTLHNTRHYPLAVPPPLLLLLLLLRLRLLRLRLRLSPPLHKPLLLPE